MTSNPEAPNRPDEWLRLRRHGDQLAIWRVQYYPTLSHQILFEGRYDDPAVAKILLGAESLTPPNIVPEPPKPPAVSLLEMLRKWQSSMGCPNAQELDRAVLLAAASAEVREVTPNSVWLADMVLRKKLTSTQRDQVDDGCKVLSDYVNCRISEEIPLEKQCGGLLQLTVPVTADMIPEQSEGGVGPATLMTLYKLFEKIWDTRT